MTELAARLEQAAQRGMTLAVWAAEAPGRPAILSPHGDRTFGELNGRANRLARALRERGLRAGEAVALVCSNRPEFAEVVFACARTGLRLTPVNWHLKAEEIAYIVQDCEARALVAEVRFAQEVVPAAARCPQAGVRLAVGGPPPPGWEAYEDALAPHSGEDLPDPVLGASMLYTSGTTGKPKGVWRPNIAFAASSMQVRSTQTAAYRPGEDLHLCAGPLYHAAPLAFSLRMPLAAGVGTVLMDRWDAETFLRLVEQHRVTHTHLVPTMMVRLLALPEEVRRRYDLSSLRWVVHAAAPCPVEVKRAFMAWVGPIVHEYYAATEGGGTWVTPEEWLRKPGTVGRPAPGQQVEVRDEAGRPCPPGVVGTVWIRTSPEARFEYFKDPDKTAAVYRGDFFTVGDMGYLDEEGYLFLTDRAADLIISGGVNIYPAEVDAVLLAHPAVADAATIGVPNDEWGEEVKAVVELRPGWEPSPALEEDLVRWCRDRLAHFKCPRTVDFVDRLPREETGKVYKRLLRDRYWAGRERRI